MKYIQVTKRESGFFAYINVNHITAVTSRRDGDKVITCICTTDCTHGYSWEVSETVDEVMNMIEEVSE